MATANPLSPARCRVGIEFTGPQGQEICTACSRLYWHTVRLTCMHWSGYRSRLKQGSTRGTFAGGLGGSGRRSLVRDADLRALSRACACLGHPGGLRTCGC